MILRLLLIFSCLLRSEASWAEIKAVWNRSARGLRLEIKVAEALSEQQKKLIYSGFSTFSHLEVNWLIKDKPKTLLFISECTIKFDLWDENFEMLHFLEAKHQKTLRSVEQYVNLCLTADISQQKNLKILAEDGAMLALRLEISQVSQDFAQDVRGWLIGQQSGFMRGLFSHMLGDLKLAETISTDISVLPLGHESQQLPKRKNSDLGGIGG